MPKVLIADKMSEKAAEILRQSGIEVDDRPGLSVDELKACIAEYDGLAVRSTTKVTADILAAADKLKVIGRAGVGVDNIDTDAATAKGVVVMNTPHGNAITTAEHAIALMFALARQLPSADQSTQDGRWEKSRFMGVEITNKVLGIIGCGNIGSIVARRANGLRMKVLAHDPFLSLERAADLGVEAVELDELFARSDFITLHVPLTEMTRNIIDAASIKKMKRGVRIINCARGGLINEPDLKAALDSGDVAGAALDVFEVEPAKENPLFGMPNVVATPHLGASTEEAQENVAVQVANQMVAFLLSGAISNAVNMASITAEDAPRLRPYLHLAEQLGSFAGQLIETGVRSVQVEYEGAVEDYNTRPLTAALLAGLLSPLMESVNLVNAGHLARERNIDIAEVRHERPAVAEGMRIRLTVKAEGNSRSVYGTIYGDVPRIIRVEDVDIEAQLGPHMVFMRSKDRPGMIGSIGSILGDAGINIATFHLGRSSPGGEAISLIEVDEPVPDLVMDQICAHPSVIQCRALHF